MRISPVQGREFLQVVEPALRDAGLDGLASVARGRWTGAQICGLLRAANVTVRRMASLTLGLIGDRSVTKCLALGLADHDRQVYELSENALWSIWFRSGAEKAQHDFRRGMEFMNGGRPAEAIDWFHRAHELDDQFSEAFNQCALAHYMVDDWSAALADCRRAVELEPVHFGALAGMGHCFAHMEDFAEAARCYRLALRVNPRMDALVDGLNCIEARVMPRYSANSSKTQD